MCFRRLTNGFGAKPVGKREQYLSRPRVLDPGQHFHQALPLGQTMTKPLANILFTQLNALAIARRRGNGQQADSEKTKAAKKEFTGAKKAVKEVVKLQTERLYEALCTKRT